MTIDGEELTSHSCRIIFSPDLLLRATPLDKIRGPLSLGLAISHLNECVDNYPILSEELQKLERKLESEAELEDSEVCVCGCGCGCVGVGGCECGRVCGWVCGCGWVCFETYE